MSRDKTPDFLTRAYRLKPLAYSVNHRSQSRRTLLIANTDDVMRFDFERAGEQFRQAAIGGDHPLHRRQLPMRRITTDANDGVDLGKIEQQRRLDAVIAR